MDKPLNDGDILRESEEQNKEPRCIVVGSGWHNISAKAIADAVSLTGIPAIDRIDFREKYTGRTLPFSVLELMNYTATEIKEMREHSRSLEVECLKKRLLMWYHIKVGYRCPSKRVTPRRISLKYRFKRVYLDRHEDINNIRRIYTIDDAYAPFEVKFCKSLISSMQNFEGDFYNKEWYDGVAELILKGTQGYQTYSYDDCVKSRIQHDRYMIP